MRLDRRAELVLGALAFVYGSWLLYDALERKGSGTPWPLGAVLPY